MIRIFLFLLCFLNSGALALPESESFDSVLSRLKAKSIEKSPDIGQLQATLQQKNAQSYTSWTKWLPHADLQFSQKYSRDYSLLVSGNLPTIFAGYTPPSVALSGWNLTVSLPLYRRSVHLGVVQSSEEASLAETQLKQALMELDWRMRSYLGNYLLQVYKVAAVESSIQIAKANQREAKMRFELGQRTKIDVLRTDANVISLESKRLSYQQEKTANASALQEYSGLNDSDLASIGLSEWLVNESQIFKAIDVFSEVEGIKPALLKYFNPEDPRETVDDSLRQVFGQQLAADSPVYRSIVSEQQVSDTRASALTAQEWPELTAQGSIYKQASRWGQLFDGHLQSYSAGVVLNIPLSLGGSLFSSSREASSARDVARLKAEKDLLKLRNEIESEWLQTKALYRSMESFKLNLEQNQEIVRLSTKSYDLGKITLVELLGSQNDLMESKINYAKSRIDLAVLMRRFAANLGVSIP